MRVDASQIKIGDVIRHYGCTFEITETNVYSGYDRVRMHRDEHGPGHPVYAHKTRLLEYMPHSMPKAWADTWVFQGNCYAYFDKIN